LNKDGKSAAPNLVTISKEAPFKLTISKNDGAEKGFEEEVTVKCSNRATSISYVYKWN